MPFAPMIAHCLKVKQGGQPRKGMHHAAQSVFKSERGGGGRAKNYFCDFLWGFHVLEGHAEIRIVLCYFFSRENNTLCGESLLLQIIDIGMVPSNATHPRMVLLLLRTSRAAQTPFLSAVQCPKQKPIANASQNAPGACTLTHLGYRAQRSTAHRCHKWRKGCSHTPLRTSSCMCPGTCWCSRYKWCDLGCLAAPGRSLRERKHAAPAPSYTSVAQVPNPYPGSSMHEKRGGGGGGGMGPSR